MPIDLGVEKICEERNEVFAVNYTVIYAAERKFGRVIAESQ